jgi:hypothetical protein
MKSIQLLTTSLLFILSLSSIAQEEQAFQKKFFVGVHVAPTYSNRAFGMASDCKPAMGFVSGISGQYNFSPRWSLHVELNYERTRYTILDRNVYGPNAAIPIGDRLTRTFYSIGNIQLPISMKYNFIHKEKISVFVNAGTILNFVSDYNGVSDYADGSTRYYHLRSGFNHSVGLIAGLGTDITLSQRMHLTLEGRATDCSFISYGLFTGFTYQLSK